MYQLIERHPSAADQGLELGGRSYPVPAVVEDEDGLRLLLIRGYFLPVSVWLWAHAQGVVAIVSADNGRFVLDDVFTDNRTESQTMGNYVLAETWWQPYRPHMSYLEMTGDAHGHEPSTWTEGPEPTGEIRPEGFVNLHTHTEHSAWDGLATMTEVMAAVTADGQTAVAVTDHGTCAGHPALQLAADKAGVKPIFGMEAYFVDDRHDRESREYMHLVLWAMDDTGLRNLWAMSTEGFDSGFYGKPRIDWDTLERLNEGVLASTACLAGPLARPYLADDEERALANLARLKAVFGDRLYIELHANHLPEQLRVNEWLVQVSADHDVPLVAVADAHYAHAEDYDLHQVWIRSQSDKDIADETQVFTGGELYHLHSGDEMTKALGYLDAETVAEAIANTVRVARRCTARMEQRSHKPVFSRVSKEWPDPVEHDVDRLLELCMQRWEERTGGKAHPFEVYRERFEREFDLIVAKGFAGYFLMVSDIVRWAKNNKILVGPGRGSGGGSLVGYLCGITEIDPVQHSLLFERFMTEGRTELPDFDVDFPSSKKLVLFDYVRDRWGADHVAVVGTHMRMKNKGVVRSIAKTVASTLPENHYMDIDAVCKVIDEAEASTAGLGMSWDDLWVQEEERLGPYRDKYPDLFKLCDHFVGRLKGYGTHPAGIIIDKDHPLTGALPLRRGGEGAPMVAQFDLTALEALGYVKFDLLNITTLDIVQMTVDLIEETTSRWIDVYSWRHDEEYADPMVFEPLGEGWTLGVFQVGTNAGTRLVRRFKPTTVDELAAVITLVRPGPMRSGLTETYFRRRNGEEEVYYPDPRLESVLGGTYGCMLFQEDIMAVCMTLAGYDSNEADKVRKILGKKKVELAAEEGRKFVERAVANDTDRDVAETLWAQMEEFAKYSFNRAHAFAYAIVGHWTSWFKFHYSSQALCSLLSNVDKDKIPDYVEEARRMGFHVLPPDINRSKIGFTADTTSVRYGLGAINGVGGVAAEAILAGQPYTSYEDFLERKTGKCNMGVVEKLTRVGAFDSLGVDRRYLEALQTYAKTPGTTLCQFKGDERKVVWLELFGGEQTVEERTLPCAFDWPSEEFAETKTGRKAKHKPPPKRCDRGCRHFSPSPPPAADEVEPYGEEEIRGIEMDMLGVFLSSTPFDAIPEHILDELVTGADIQVSGSGTYLLAVYVRSIRTQKDKYDRKMAFVKCMTPSGVVEATVFSGEYITYADVLQPGQLGFMQIKKNNRGNTLDLFEPI